MKNNVILLLGLAAMLTAATGRAQESTAASTAKLSSGQEKSGKMSPAEQEYARLLERVKAARAAHFQKLREDAAKAREAARQGKATRMRSISLKMPPPPPEVLAGFREAAKTYAGTDDAIRFLVYLLGVEGDAGAARKLTERLLRDHLQSGALVTFPAALPRLQRKLGAEHVEKLYQRLIEKSPHDPVRASAYFARATTRARGAEQEASKERKLADLRKALALDPRGAFAKRAEGILFEAEHLAIGCVAPDIVGKDTDGVKFRLHDYKGKVILLDFWGDW